MPRSPECEIERVTTDGHKVSRNEAIFLTAHHLILAAKYFEAIPEGPEGISQVMESLKDMTDTIRDKKGKDLFTDPCIEPSRAFLISIFDQFEQMKGND